MDQGSGASEQGHGEGEPFVIETVNSLVPSSSTAPLSKASVETMMKNKSQRITLALPKSTQKQSPVWESFLIICLDKIQLDYVVCTKCDSVLIWKNGNTSTLSRHASYCKSRSTAGTTAVQLNLDQYKKKTMPTSSIRELNESITIGLAKDLKPLGMVKGFGFLHIAQQLINVGAKFGFQDAKAIIHHPGTLKRNLPGIVEKKKTEILKSLKTAPSFPKVAFTTDMWTDTFRQRHFLSLSVHFVDKDFNLKSHLLEVKEFPDLEKTTANIRVECRSMIRDALMDDSNLEDLDALVDNIFENSVAVTDGGSNFVNVFPVRLPCMCHRLNNVMQWSFNETVPKPDAALPPNSKKKFVFSRECPTTSESVAGVKNLVTYFKRSGLNCKLQETLKQENNTRWNSKLTMLKSYKNSAEGVKRILLDKNQLVRLVGIDDSAVDNIIEYLEVFKSCTEAWSSEKQPTLQAVALWIQDLYDHVEIKITDSEEIKKLKAQARVCIQEYLHLDDMHLVALMLHPRYKKLKKLKFIDAQQKTKALTLLRKLAREITFEGTEGAGNASRGYSDAPERKRGRFDALQDSDSDIDQFDEQDEVDTYMEMKINKDEPIQFLDFWKNASQFPRLRKVAAWVAGIPASQTSDERVFSATGATLSPRRTELKGGTLSKLTYVHKNFTI